MPVSRATRLLRRRLAPAPVIFELWRARTFAVSGLVAHSNRWARTGSKLPTEKRLAAKVRPDQHRLPSAPAGLLAGPVAR